MYELLIHVLTIKAGLNVDGLWVRHHSALLTVLPSSPAR